MKEKNLEDLLAVYPWHCLNPIDEEYDGPIEVVGRQHVFPSGDTPDLLLRCSKSFIVVEVKLYANEAALAQCFRYITLVKMFGVAPDDMVVRGYVAALDSTIGASMAAMSTSPMVCLSRVCLADIENEQRVA